MALHFFVCFKYVHQPRLEFLNVDKFGLDVAFLWGGWFFHCVCLTAFQLVPPSHEDKKKCLQTLANVLKWLGQGKSLV